MLELGRAALAVCVTAEILSFLLYRSAQCRQILFSSNIFDPVLRLFKSEAFKLD